MLRGGTHGPCTSPHTAHTGTHIHSPSQPSASGPWAEPGARSSPPPPSHGMPGMDTPRWSPAPPVLEHRCGEGRAQAQEKGARTVRYPHYFHSLLCCWHPSRAPQPTVCPLLPISLQSQPPGQKRGDSGEHPCEAAASSAAPIIYPSLAIDRYISHEFLSVHGSAVHRLKPAAMCGACVQACTCGMCVQASASMWWGCARTHLCA